MLSESSVTVETRAGEEGCGLWEGVGVLCWQSSLLGTGLLFVLNSLPGAACLNARIGAVVRSFQSYSLDPELSYYICSALSLKKKKKSTQ